MVSILQTYDLEYLNQLLDPANIRSKNLENFIVK